MSGQVDPDDVLTKEEQIYLLVEAKEKCQRDIKAQLEKIKGSILTLRMGGGKPGDLAMSRRTLSPPMAAGRGQGDLQRLGTTGSRDGFVQLLGVIRG